MSSIQLVFLSIAAEIYQDWRSGLGSGWFPKRDVFSGRYHQMPVRTANALVKRGLLETDPPGNEWRRYDLSYRITEAGLRELEAR